MSTERATKRRRLSPMREDETVQKPSKRKSTAEPSTSSRMSQPIPHLDKAENERKGKQAEDLPVVKGLDSSDATTRRKTLTTILSHLQNRSAQNLLTKSQCLQIWRGFHVAIYMHDSKNALSVQNLLRDIAGTFSTISSKDNDIGKQDSNKETQSSTLCPWLVPYHEAFWETIIREWADIDSHRMNKYLLLVRLVMRELFTVCIEQPEVEAELELTNIRTKSVLTTLSTIGPLNPIDVKIPNGLRLHILDVWVDELCNALDRLDRDEESSTEQTETLVTAFFLDPVKRIAAVDSGAQKFVRLRAKDVIVDFERRIPLDGEVAEQ